ncbi:HAMP domain-containing histidine kinase [Rhodococcus pyridinivorans]|uniref:sensor histidine kinase n=1 Tax=Rhodococcus pyridinivorans TaxID=103816 RepID=UPI00110F48C0|nr:HAMP domain-containing sensor histidine kinase [Rhodococcus pyridinivorans]UPW04544.1 HAMP domain-containing histidine kinase [Rhodococcus pyridinivorans]
MTTESGKPAGTERTGHLRIPHPGRGSALPARWRILSWILLTTAVALVAVVVTARVLLLNHVDRDANADITQEIDEFRAFAAEGVDPTTTFPFTSVERMLEVYLNRQHTSEGEVIVGVVDGSLLFDRRIAVDRPDLPANLTEDGVMFERILNAPTGSGVHEVDGGQMRWARADVTSGDDRGALIVAVFTAEQRAKVADTARTIGLVAIGGLGLTAIIGWLVAGQILAPIRQVREVAAAIGEKDLTSRVPVHGRDDIAALAQTFNSMLDRLEQAYTTQQQFVDDAGHELRTPITVIRGHLELMDLGHADDATREETIRLVEDELDRMARIVTDLLVLAKAERPDFVQRRPVDVTDLMLDVEAKAQMLGTRDWQLMEIAEGMADIDAQRVTQAVLQYATNAVTHTHPGDVIQLGSVFVEHDGTEHLRIWVRDTGPGVAPDDAARIFERFRRGRTVPGDRHGPAAERGGAGLGLAIVRAIADAHHGSAWVESAVGHGATFGIDLPLRDPAGTTGTTGTTGTAGSPGTAETRRTASQ